MNFVTDFADQALLLPVAVTVGLGLLLLGWRRGATAWAMSVAITLLLVLLAKIAASDCGVWLPWHAPLHPSGHTAGSALIYGGGVALLAKRRRAGRWIAFLMGSAVACGIGFTRVALGVHSVADILAGGAIGVWGAVALRHLAGPRPADLPWRSVAVAAGLAMVLFHGERLQAEARIRGLHVWPFSLCLGTTYQGNHRKKLGEKGSPQTPPLFK